MMNLEPLINSDIFNWIILPLLIFLARIVDVSLGTIRISFVSKGLKHLASICGFVEVIIWLLAIRVIMQNLNNPVCYIAYGAGFGMGTFIGLQIEKKLALGDAVIRIVTQKDATDLINALRSQGFGVTSIDGEGAEGKVNVLYVIIKRHDFQAVSTAIEKFNPNAFYTLEDLKLVSRGIFPNQKARYHFTPIIGPFRFWRKGK
jgi:uncharacterized protein YebE (UPF0316 family)